MGSHAGSRGEYAPATRDGVNVFDLARRFALLESAAGPSTVRIARVVASGNSAACARCGWRVLATDAACENCGLARANHTDDTVGFGLPAATVVVRDDAFVSRTSDLRGLVRERTLPSVFSNATEWTGREAWRCGPKTFRRRIASLIQSFESSGAVDVISRASARSRWIRVTGELDAAVGVHTPRSLVDYAWSDPRILVIDAPAAFDPSSRTFRRLVEAPHRFVIVRASEKRFADPDAVFALTDLLAPGTFASVVEARTLHRRDLAAFVARRDSVVAPSTPRFGRDDPARVPADAHHAVLAAVTASGVRFDRRVCLLAESPRGLAIADPTSAIASMRPDARGDEHPPRLAADALRSLFSADIAANARSVASTIARLARAYAERVDLAPRSVRASVADEFARRAELLIDHGTLRICVDVLASVTLRASPRP